MPTELFFGTSVALFFPKQHQVFVGAFVATAYFLVKVVKQGIASGTCNRCTRYLASTSFYAAYKTVALVRVAKALCKCIGTKRAVYIHSSTVLIFFLVTVVTFFARVERYDSNQRKGNSKDFFHDRILV